ncbi:hypothetical protein AA103196_0582 [Ameyamaea chiangmaiensis NBRC 103196]|nr:hypothetical protein AA103196_0582 [Ameyamaea chiangmaiensis NBRC 103196]
MSTEKTFYINNTGTFFTSKNLLLNTRSDTFEVEGFNIDEAIKNQNKKLESIRDLEKKDTRVFIFGNPDLTEVSSETDGFSNIVKKYRNQDLENACVCLSRAFPTGQNIFVFIVRQELALQNLSFCHQYITVGKSITDCSDRDLNDIFVNIPTSWENLSGIVSGNNKRLEKNRAGEIAFDARNQRIEVDETKVTRRDRIFCLDGNSGNALWGPYVSIDPGSYEVRFDFSTASNYGECLLEILADVGQTHIKSAIYGGKGLGRCPVATLSFDTLAPLHDVEFRIAIKRVFKGEISRISLKKL